MQFRWRKRPSFCATRAEGWVWRGRNDEPVFVLVPRCVQINPSELLFLVDVLSAAARRCAVLSAAVPFSLDPLPYRAVQISILAATIPILFYLGQLLSGSRAVAFLVALAMCYHAHLANLVFGGSFIYDVLCGFFYFAALTYYVRIREKGMALGPGQLAIFWRSTSARLTRRKWQEPAGDRIYL